MTDEFRMPFSDTEIMMQGDSTPVSRCMAEVNLIWAEIRKLHIVVEGLSELMQVEADQADDETLPTETESEDADGA